MNRPNVRRDNDVASANYAAGVNITQPPLTRLTHNTLQRVQIVICSLKSALEGIR